MIEKNDDFAGKVRQKTLQTAEEKKREIQEKRRLYCFIPKDAPPIWRRVMEVTNGKGISPYQKKILGIFGSTSNGYIELEEYRGNVPRCLRRMKGFAPDEVASMLGLEDDQVLYEKLYWSGRKPEEDVPEYIQEHEDSRLKTNLPKPKYSIPLEMGPDFLWLEEQERKRDELEKQWYEEVCLY